MRGFVYEIAVIGSLFICYFFGFRAAEIAGEYLNKIFNADALTMHYASVFAGWILISIGVFFLAKLFEGLINLAALGIFNKIAGAFFGAFKYAFILSIGFYFLNKIELSWFSADDKASSFWYYKILKMSSWVMD